MNSFSPARWLPGRHLQTILPNLLRRPTRHPTRRVQLDLPDGDFLDIDVIPPDGPVRGFLLCVHGLEGSSRSPYILGTVDEARRQGLLSVAINQRGCSGRPNRLARSYCAGTIRDIRTVLHWIRERHPGLPGGIVGFSLGANQLTRFLGEEPDEVPDEVRAAVGVSPPFEMSVVADVLDSPKGIIYRAYFLITLVPKALQKARRFPEKLDRRAILANATSFRGYDDTVTAPLHGFDSVDAYYHACSGNRFLAGIECPTRFIAAVDDPIIPGDVIPTQAIGENPNLSLLETEAGGHVGFVSGPLRNPTYWAEEQAVRYVIDHL